MPKQLSMVTQPMPRWYKCAHAWGAGQAVGLKSWVKPWAPGLFVFQKSSLRGAKFWWRSCHRPRTEVMKSDFAMAAPPPKFSPNSHKWVCSQKRSDIVLQTILLYYAFVTGLHSSSEISTHPPAVNKNSFLRFQFSQPSWRMFLLHNRKHFKFRLPAVSLFLQI